MVTRILIILLALAVSASAQRICPPMLVNRNGIVGRWLVPGKQTGNVATPNLCLDDSGKGNKGTTVASPNYGVIFSRPAMTFNGSSQYVSMSDTSALKPSNITVSAWVKSSSISSQQLIFDHQSASPYYGYSLQIYQSKVAFGIKGTGAEVDSQGGTTLSSNTWYFITATYDGTTMKVYLNGVLDGSVGNTGNIDYTSSVTPTIGIRSTTLNSNGFNGSIDDVRVYNRALSASEIRAIYQGEQ